MSENARFSAKFRFLSGLMLGLIGVGMASILGLYHRLSDTPEQLMADRMNAPRSILMWSGLAALVLVIWLIRIPLWKRSGAQVSPLQDLKALTIEVGTACAIVLLASYVLRAII